MKYKLKVYSIQDPGQRVDSEGNSHQEDSMFPAPGEVKDSDRLFILCDGMGGHDAGEVASATVCEAMSASILRDGLDADNKFTPEVFQNALNEAFDALDAKDNGAEKKMGTTMTFLKFHSQGAFVAHIGDSRVYHIRPGKTGKETEILFETRDHSLVNDLVRLGQIKPEEAHNHPQKNVITRAMQPALERRPKADVKEIADIKKGDYFYMCSDGMIEAEDMENGNSLRTIFSNEHDSDEDRVKTLLELTKFNHDNHSAFIIHVEDVTEPLEESTEIAFATKKAKDEDASKKKSSLFSNLKVLVICILLAIGMIVYWFCFREVEDERVENEAKPKIENTSETKPNKPAKPSKPQPVTSSLSDPAASTPSGLKPILPPSQSQQESKRPTKEEAKQALDKNKKTEPDPTPTPTKTSTPKPKIPTSTTQAEVTANP